MEQADAAMNAVMEAAMPKTDVIIELNNVGKSYRTAAGEVQALKNINWRVG
jgi:hypothetical protein